MRHSMWYSGQYQPPKSKFPTAILPSVLDAPALSGEPTVEWPGPVTEHAPLPRLYRPQTNHVSHRVRAWSRPKMKMNPCRPILGTVKKQREEGKEATRFGKQRSHYFTSADRTSHTTNGQPVGKSRRLTLSACFAVYGRLIKSTVGRR